MGISKKTKEFLKESNAIEGVYDEDSLLQAIYAWKYLINEDILDTHAVLKTHKILMLHQSLLPNEKGYFRKCAVYIGGREATDYNVVPDRIDLWIGTMEMFLKEVCTKDQSEKLSKTLHVDYEFIHPFIDGNGRTGRMFMNWWRIKKGLPILIIHEGKEQQDYYDWFT